jgi:hypothetical protein
MDMKMTLRRGSLALALASILFPRYLPWSFQVCWVVFLALGTITVVAPARVLAVLVALAVRFRNDIIKPANERPMAFAPAVIAMVTSKSGSA